MTIPDSMRAAAEVLRATDTPLHVAVADWLDDTRRDMQVRISVWETAYDPLFGGNGVIEANAETLYAYPLAVARAVLEGAVPT